jgi:hypothetical protein
MMDQKFVYVVHWKCVLSTRLIFDLIEKMEEDDIPDLLVLLDFEKAFNTVEWSFLYKIYNFLALGSRFVHFLNLPKLVSVYLR